MGQSSSQLQEPTQLPVNVDDDMEVTPADRPGTADTSGSQALARDLEKSIMDSSQDVERQQPKKKRKTKKAKRQAADETSPLPETTQQAEPTMDDNPQTVAEATHRKKSSRKLKDGDDPFEIARRDVQKWLKRKQMQEAVLENRAKWVQMPNQKWGIKFYKPGEAPEKELTEEEKASLVVIKKEMENYRRAMENSTPRTERQQQAEEMQEQRVEEPQEEQVGDKDTAKTKRKKKKRNAINQEDAAQEGQVMGEDNTMAERASPPAEATAQIEDQGDVVEAVKPKSKKRKRKTSEQAPALPPEPVAESDELRPKKQKKQKTEDLTEPVLADKRPIRDSVRQADLLQKGLQENADHVNAWLASQEPPEALPESKDVDAGVEVKPDKRKRNSQCEKEDEEDYHPLSKPTESSPPTATSGAFTKEERAICDIVFGQVQKRLNLSDAELKRQIQQWRTAGYFKAELELALPNRSKDQIRKFAKRRYHPYERGPWTAAQDAALRDAHARWPDQWTKICELVDRSASDCKDRWLKQLRFGDSRATGPWSQNEENKLLEVVEECIDTIKKEKHQDKVMLNDPERLESMISWRVVSDKVAGGRSAKQCREKYAKIKTRQQKEDTQVSTKVSVRKSSEDEIKKHKQAKKALESFEIGDYFDVFVEVHTAFADHSAEFHDEKNVLWSIVAQKNPASRFNMVWIGGALRRFAVEKALTEWPINSKKIKRKIEQAQTIPAKALQLAKLVEKRCGGVTDSLPRTFKPELIGKTAAELAAMKRANKKERPTKKGELSKELVSSSEEDDDEDDDEVVIQESPPTVKRQHKPGKEPTPSEDEDEEEQEVPETSEDELASSRRESRPEASQAPETDQDEDAAAHDSDASDNETNEDEDDDNATEAVAETQPEQAEHQRSRRSRVPKHDDEDVLVSSISSRVGPEVQGSPSLSPEAFLQRCKTAGKRQHEQYVAQTSSGSAKRRK